MNSLLKSTSFVQYCTQVFALMFIKHYNLTASNEVIFFNTIKFVLTPI